MGLSMRVKEVNVWMRDDVIKALRFKATNCVVQEKRCNDIADKIKRGDILIVHNPDRNKEANASCNNVHIALQQDQVSARQHARRRCASATIPALSRQACAPRVGNRKHPAVERVKESFESGRQLRRPS